MKNKRGLKRRFGQLWSDVQGIAMSNGLKILVLYSLSKAIGKVWHHKLLVRARILDSWMYLNLLDPGISYQLLVHGVRERRHVEQVSGAVTTGMRGMEVGANIGYYALLEGHLVGPTGHIYCIEPAPDNFALLRKNIAENHFEDRTSCFQYLVGERNGTGKLFLASAANSHSVSKISDRFVELPMVTIDHFLASEHINPADIDFLRMDIEGYEVMVLQHMGTLLANRTKPLKLFIELHPSSYPQWGWTLEKLLEYLEGLGFVIRSVAEEGIRDERGAVVDRLVGMKNATELSTRYREWERTKNQRGLLAFFELPVQ